MIITGLTGSIAMGKSTTAKMVRALGIPVHDADASVHSLMAAGGAGVAPIVAYFGSGVCLDDGIDRSKLSAAVFGNPEALKALEQILHPLVRMRTKAFLRHAARAGHRRVVLDIPLLYETGAETRVDQVFVASASAVIQRQRVLARPGMTAAKLHAILTRQLPDTQKRLRADAVIPTGAGRAFARRALVDALQKPVTAKAWPSGWGGAFAFVSPAHS